MIYLHETTIVSDPIAAHCVPLYEQFTKGMLFPQSDGVGLFEIVTTDFPHIGITRPAVAQPEHIGFVKLEGI